MGFSPQLQESCPLLHVGQLVTKGNLFVAGVWYFSSFFFFAAIHALKDVSLQAYSSVYFLHLFPYQTFPKMRSIEILV